MIVRHGTSRRYQYQINSDKEVADKILEALGMNVERSVPFNGIHAEPNSGKKATKMATQADEVQKYSNTKSGAPVIEKVPAQLTLVQSTPPEQAPVPPEKEEQETPAVPEPATNAAPAKPEEPVVRRAVVRRGVKTKPEVAFSLLEATLVERVVMHPTPIYIEELEAGLATTKYSFVQAVDRLLKVGVLTIEEKNECQFFSINKKNYSLFKDALFGAGTSTEITPEEKMAFLASIRTGFSLNQHQRNVLAAIVSDVKAA
jgi:hypothetical protein